MKIILLLLLALYTSQVCAVETDREIQDSNSKHDCGSDLKASLTENHNISVIINVDDRLSLEIPGYFRVYDPDHHMLVARTATDLQKNQIEVKSLEADNCYQNKTWIGAKAFTEQVYEDNFTQEGLLGRLQTVGSDALDRELKDTCAEYLVEMKEHYNEAGYKIIGSIDVYNDFIGGKISVCFNFLMAEMKLGNITEVTQYHIPLTDFMAHIYLTSSTDSKKAENTIKNIRQSVRFL